MRHNEATGKSRGTFMNNSRQRQPQMFALRILLEKNEEAALWLCRSRTLSLQDWCVSIEKICLKSKYGNQKKGLKEFCVVMEDIRIVGVKEDDRRNMAPPKGNRHQAKKKTGDTFVINVHQNHRNTLCKIRITCKDTLCLQNNTIYNPTPVDVNFPYPQE